MYIKLPKEKKDILIQEIQAYFQEEKGEDWGLIAAENLLDFFMQRLGPNLYNQGVQDAKQLVSQLLLNIEEDISSLERPIKRDY
ncbi:hypothetical protein GCM10008967_26860 [Bacillus carboniphilus]|uniref:DUF2164 domain-containing protein n=1 Tax=Bacillus carboniphilus TaxID=86663 RepID=A0ABN0WEG2_9BACI